MWVILSKYGLPDEIINVIKKLYESCLVQFNVDGKMKDILYMTSVQQGNNMVLPLFIYVLQVAMETLKKFDASRTKPDFRFFPNQKGRLTNQPTITCSKSFEMTDLLFIDDMAIVCKTRKDIEELSQLILDHLTKFGLQYTQGQNKTSQKWKQCTSQNQ